MNFIQSDMNSQPISDRKQLFFLSFLEVMYLSLKIRQVSQGKTKIALLHPRKWKTGIVLL